MRLVNKEFEAKVLAHLFRVVVVPFKPELYGIAPEPPVHDPNKLHQDTSKGSIMLQDKGMRVFSGYVTVLPIEREIDRRTLSLPTPTDRS